jgi:RNA recognition motif-containing protein
VRIYVGNLPFSMREDELRALFEPHGAVASVDIIMERDTGRSRGFGFVEMSNDDEARTAIDALNDHEADGRPLRVNEARPRPERRGGGGGRGGRGGGRGGGGRYNDNW